VNPRRLYRSRRDRQLAGVAAGMAEYLDLDPTLVRVLWIVSALFGGVTILLYIILAFVMPLEPETTPAPGWGRSAGPAGGPPPTRPTGSEPTGEATGSAAEPGPTVEQTAAGSPADGAGMGPAWSAPQPDPTSAVEWAAPEPRPRPDGGRGGRAGLIVGVMLIVFGAIALVDVAIPGWSAAGLLWPAFILALGAALLVGSIRRTADER